MEVSRDGAFTASTAVLMDQICEGLTSKKIQGIAEGEALRLVALDFARENPGASKAEFYQEAKSGKFYRKELQSGQVGGLALAEALRLASLIRTPSESTFVDLGSGDGRQVLLASILQPFARLIGVEIMPALHNLAGQSLERSTRLVKPLAEQVVAFHQADVLAFDWAHADVLLLTWTCFPVALREAIMRRAAELKPDSVAITITHEITCEGWTCLDTKKRSMSWGVGTVFVYRKCSSASSSSSSSASASSASSASSSSSASSAASSASSSSSAASSMSASILSSSAASVSSG